MTDLIVVPHAAQWQRLKRLVLDSASSPITKRVYNLGLDEFFAWYELEPRPGFTKAAVSAWRVALEGRGLPGIRRRPVSHTLRVGLPRARVLVSVTVITLWIGTWFEAKSCPPPPNLPAALAGDRTLPRQEVQRDHRVDVVFRLWQCDKDNQGWREGPPRPSLPSFDLLTGPRAPTPAIRSRPWTSRRPTAPLR